MQKKPLLAENDKKYVWILFNTFGNRADTDKVGESMFLTKECDYAIRVVRALLDYEKKTVKTICEREHVPFNFAYKILKKLEKNGMVHSVRGSHGGYQLSKEPARISIYDIISTINENLYINECLKPGHDCPHNSDGIRCTVHEKLIFMQSELIDTLKATTMDMFL